MPSSTQGDFIRAVADTIEGLALNGLTGGVRLAKFAARRDGIAMPAVFVCPVPEQFPMTGTNSEDDTAFGAQVVMARVSNQSLDIDEDDQMLEWREKIRQAFREKRVSGVAGSYRTTVDAGPVFDPTAFANQFDASILIVRTTVREQRT